MNDPSLRHRTALTLVEVLVSLVLAAVVLTAMVRAHARSAQQLHATERLNTATMLARHVIAEWRVHKPQFIAPSGTLADFPDWTWRRTERSTQVVDDPHVLDVELEIVHTRPGHDPDVVARLTWLEREPDGPHDVR